MNEENKFRKRRRCIPKSATFANQTFDETTSDTGESVKNEKLQK